MAQRHMDRLTSFDASFLANEKANAHMAIGAVLVCEGPPPAQADFLAHIRSRVHQLPRLRQRLLYPPLRLGTPFWVDDEPSTSTTTSGASPCRAPGGEAELRALVGELLAPPLDRRHPLWQLTLVEGLADDRFAIVYKTHHAMADGISAVDIGMLLFDLEPRPEPDRDRIPLGARPDPLAPAPRRPRRRRPPLRPRAGAGATCGAPPATRPGPAAAPATASPASGR